MSEGIGGSAAAEVIQEMAQRFKDAQIDRAAQVIKAAWLKAAAADVGAQWCDEFSIHGETDFFAKVAADALLHDEASS